MKFLCFIGAAGAVIYGGMIWLDAASAIHQIAALVCWLIGAVLFSACGIMETIERQAKNNK